MSSMPRRPAVFMTFSGTNEQREQAGAASLAPTQTGHTDCRITEMMTIVHHLTSSRIDIRVPFHVGLRGIKKILLRYLVFLQYTLI